MADLVITPFRDIVDKGKTAVINAGNPQPMLKAAQSLLKEGERALRRIEPLCKKHLDEYGPSFLAALKENDKISDIRAQLNELLWEFDDYVEIDDFDTDKFAQLQAISRKAAPKVYNILMRTKFEVQRTADPRNSIFQVFQLLSPPLSYYQSPMTLSEPPAVPLYSPSRSAFIPL